jgi:head-tail adaptor
MILQSFTGTSDGQGGSADTVTNVETIKGSLQPMSKDKVIAYGKPTSTPMFIFIVEGKKVDRTTRTITTAQKFLYGTRTFQVLFVANQFESNNILKIDLQEGTNVSY